MKLRSFPVKIKAAVPVASSEESSSSTKKTKKGKKGKKVKAQIPVPKRTASKPLPFDDGEDLERIPQDDDLANLLSSLSSLNFGKKNNTGENLPDPVSMLENAIEQDFDLSIFNTLSFPPAPNIIEWCRGREYLNATSQPNARQFQVLAHLYGEVCFFCSDLDFIFDVPVDAKMGEVLERFVLLEHGICPICRRNKLEIFHEWSIDPRFFVYHDHLDSNVPAKATQYNELCAVWGQRSGKSLTASTFVSTYHIHRYLGINDPMRYYGEPSNKVFEATFVAPVVPQVNKYLWTPFCQALAGSPWFKEVVDHYKYEGKKLGVKLFRSGTTFMNFVDKRLTLHMAAANSSTLRGGTRILAAVDELGWFNYEESGSNSKRTNSKAGEEIFRALDRSLSTIRTKATKRWKAGDFNTLQALMLNISSPSSLHDPIMQRLEASHRSQRIYATHYATYEVNPDYTKESLTEEFSDQIETLLRDYFAIPPAAASPFISDKSIIENRVYLKDDVPQPFSYEITKVDSSGGLSLLRPELRNVKADKLYPRLLTVDNGEQRNSFALCLSRYLPEIDGILFEEFMEIAPHSGRVVDLAWCHNEVVLKLIEQFNILVVGYDRWNSAYSFYDLRTNKKINAERYSLKWQDFREFKEDLLGENVWMSKPEPGSSIEDLLKINDLAMRSRFPRLNFQVQLLTVNEFARKVIKPDFGNDDLFRCAALAHRLLEKYRKDFKAQAKYIKAQARRGTKVGVMRANSTNPLFFRLPRAAYAGFNYNAALGRTARGSRGSSRTERY